MGMKPPSPRVHVRLIRLDQNQHDSAPPKAPGGIDHLHVIVRITAMAAIRAFFSRYS
jgi:hypothetical protein